MLIFLEHLILTAILLLLVSNLVSGFYVRDFGSALVGALVLGFVNAVVKPLMILLTLPFTVVTFGFFLLVINAFMLWLVAAFVSGIRIQGFGSALLGSLVLTLLNLAVELLI
ncbi:MAG: phage holin family protein [Methylococcales bacterium]